MPSAAASRRCVTAPASSSTIWSARTEILYRSPEPVLTPESKEERKGIVDNVVFPTGLDPRPDLGEHVYDVYYGMSDYAVGAARITIETPTA